MPFSRTWSAIIQEGSTPTPQSLWEGRNLPGRLFAPSCKTTSSHEDRRESTFCQWALEPFHSFLLLLPFPKAAVTMNLEHCFWCPWEREERDTAYKPRQQGWVLSNIHILLAWKSRTLPWQRSRLRGGNPTHWNPFPCLLFSKDPLERCRGGCPFWKSTT